MPANAQTITKRVCEFMAEATLGKCKLCGIGMDGASSMNGFITHLNTLVPCAIFVHCTSHDYT